MMRILLSLIFVFTIAFSYAQYPKVIAGTLKLYDSFPSKYVDAKNVDV